MFRKRKAVPAIVILNAFEAKTKQNKKNVHCESDPGLNVKDELGAYHT